MKLKKWLLALSTFSFFLPSVAMAQEEFPIQEISTFDFYNLSFADSLEELILKLPSAEELDSLSPSEQKAVYDFLLQAYDFYQALPQEQRKAVVNQKLEELLEWFTKQVNPLTDTEAVFRLYNKVSGEHFYTASLEEKRTLLKNDSWQDESIAWLAPITSNTPVYRLIHPKTLERLYTSDKNEYDILAKRGWKAEGIAFYSAQGFETNVPLYRLSNPNVTIGAHHYTTDEKERSTLIQCGWIDEGIAWFGLSPDSFNLSYPGNAFQDMEEEKAS